MLHTMLHRMLHTDAYIQAHEGLQKAMANLQEQVMAQEAASAQVRMQLQ